MVCNSDHIQEGRDCYMQAKTTCLNTHLVKQVTPKGPAECSGELVQASMSEEQGGVSPPSYCSMQVTGSMCAH